MEIPDRTDDPDTQPDPSRQPAGNIEIENEKLEKRLTAYYARILFFAFLTESTVKSLEDVIVQIPATQDNRRIARHLGLDINILNLV